MILTENVQAIRQQFPLLWAFLQKSEASFQSDKITVAMAKNGLPTVQINEGETLFYLHSKYNPKEEAERFIEQFTDQDKYKHIFFYGAGFAYHIEAFMEKYPNKPFSIYEPDPAVFHAYLENRKLTDLPIRFLKNIYVMNGEVSLEVYLDHFVNQVKEEVLVVIHPAYERIYKEQTAQFSKRFVEKLASKRSTLQVHENYEKLWTINSLINFKTVLQTPSIFKMDQPVFEGKPVILVAAGPSLQEELENLRIVKEQGSAYIIAVGSANKALINHGIYPDVVTSYDPTLENYQVYDEIVDKKITSIPLIFGSSVGFKTVQVFPGPMFHMITTQDTIAAYYLNSSEITNSVADASTIAVVTLELVAKLGCSKIILVGQNFSYRNNQYYSSGIGYEIRPTELTEAEKKNLVFVESVDGDQVSTSPTQVQGLREMETYITRYKNIDFINTTVGGAKIAGAEFMPLTEVMHSMLDTKAVIEDWHLKGQNDYEIGYVYRQSIVMQKQKKVFADSLDEIIKVFKKMEQLSSNGKRNDLESWFLKFDKLILKLTENKFYGVFIKPMVRVQFDLLTKSTIEIRQIKDPIMKAKETLNSYGRFVYECQVCADQIESGYQQIQMYISEKQKETVGT